MRPAKVDTSFIPTVDFVPKRFKPVYGRWIITRFALENTLLNVNPAAVNSPIKRHMIIENVC
jgi:hypothetical protein